jgi:uncharacterized membrane protein YfcA
LIGPTSHVLAEEIGTSSDRSLRRTIKLMAIGTAAGLFSGLFGVGGGLLIGVPATGGVLIGTWCQQRLATRSIALLFALVLAAAAVELLLRMMGALSIVGAAAGVAWRMCCQEPCCEERSHC